MPTAPLAPLPTRRLGLGSRPSPAGALGPPASPATLAAQIDRLADLIVSDDPPPPHRVAGAVAALIRAADAAGGVALGLVPPGLDAPAVVQHRTLGRLASRTVGRPILLDVATLADLEAILPAGGTPVQAVGPVGPCSTSTWSPTIAVA